MLQVEPNVECCSWRLDIEAQLVEPVAHVVSLHAEANSHVQLEASVHMKASHLLGLEGMDVLPDPRGLEERYSSNLNRMGCRTTSAKLASLSLKKSVYKLHHRGSYQTLKLPS